MLHGCGGIYAEPFGNLRKNVPYHANASTSLSTSLISITLLSANPVSWPYETICLGLLYARTFMLQLPAATRFQAWCVWRKGFA